MSAEKLTRERLGEVVALYERVGNVHLTGKVGHAGTYVTRYLSIQSTDKGGIAEDRAKALVELLDSLDDVLPLAARALELEALINAPEIIDFVKAVQLEAAHQRERWASSHDAGKTDADWFWLIGYLAGKALHNPPTDDGRTPDELRLHRIITVAAAAANWHAARLGKTDMRPGTSACAAAESSGITP